VQLQNPANARPSQTPRAHRAAEVTGSVCVANLDRMLTIRSAGALVTRFRLAGELQGGPLLQAPFRARSLITFVAESTSSDLHHRFSAGRVYRLAVVIDQVVADPSTSPNPTGGLDTESSSWLKGLHATGSEHDQCVARLHELLLRVAHHEVFRRAGSLQLGDAERDDIAHQASDDALMAIKAKITEFRGESRFTTWAYRFVMFEVSTKIGRHFWRRRPVAMDHDAWERLPDPLAIVPDEHAERRELFRALRRAIDEDLTDLQRRVFVAIALNEVPMDAFARELGSNRNAVYKTLFDARRKLRASLAAVGYARPVATGERA